jgi:hypothetical protein
MRRIQTLIVTLGAAVGLVAGSAACKDKHGAGASEATGEHPQAGPPAPATCPPGNAVKDGACVVVITPAQVAAVGAQQTRIDELAALLDRIDTIGAPIELFNGMRQLPQWAALKARSNKLAALDAIAGTLDNAVRTLRTFKASLGEASSRLGNLKGQLDQLMIGTGAARKLDEVRGQISTSVRAALEPLAAQVQDTIQNALVPLTAQLTRVGNLVITGCTMSELSGGGDQLKALCAQAQDGFTRARAYVDDLKARPAQLFTQVTAQLEAQLDQLVDRETRALLDAAQAKVNAALELPPAGPGTGTGSSQ